MEIRRPRLRPCHVTQSPGLEYRKMFDQRRLMNLLLPNQAAAATVVAARVLEPSHRAARSLAAVGRRCDARAVPRAQSLPAWVHGRLRAPEATATPRLPNTWRELRGAGPRQFEAQGRAPGEFDHVRRN